MQNYQFALFEGHWGKMLDLSIILIFLNKNDKININLEVVWLLCDNNELHTDQSRLKKIGHCPFAPVG